MAGIRKIIFLVHTILVISTWVICEHLTPSITDEANGVQLDDVVIKKIKLQAMQDAPPLQLYPASDKFLM